MKMPIPESLTWWEPFFDGAQAELTLTQDTIREVAFLQSIFLDDLKKKPNGLSLVDACCGKGNLTSALSLIGLYSVGVDASHYLIDQAKYHYETSECQFVCSDIRTYQPEQKFDFLVNWHCSFGYSDSDIENLTMVEAFSNLLVHNGKWVLSTYNPSDIRSNFQRFLVRRFLLPEGEMVAIRESFLEGNSLRSEWEITMPDTQKIYRSGMTRLYELSEILDLFGKHNLVIEQAYGKLTKEPYQFTSPAMILVGRKQCES